MTVMSEGISFLHSHSKLEREHPQLSNDKHLVLVDEEYKDLFTDPIPFKYRGTTYYRVPTMVFIKRRGVFLNLSR